MSGEIVITANNASTSSSYGTYVGMPMTTLPPYNGISGWTVNFCGYIFQLDATTSFTTGASPYNVTSFSVQFSGAMSYYGYSSATGGPALAGTATMPAFSYSTSSFLTGDSAQAYSDGQGGYIYYFNIRAGFFLNLLNSLDRIVYNGSDSNNLFQGDYYGIETDTVMHGGLGNDSLWGAFNAANQIFGEDGNDYLFGQGNGDTLDGGADDDYVTDGDNYPDSHGIVTFDADTLIGGSGNDNLVADGGNDRLEGGEGNDSLSGSASVASDDTLIGGSGNDLLSGGPGTDTAIFSGLRSQYITSNSPFGDAYRRITGPDGVDDYASIEFFQFDNGTYSLAQIAGTPPAITSPATFNRPENDTPVGSVTATLADPTDTLAFSITPGYDADLFTIDAATGALSFRTAPDYEHPLNTGPDNTYWLTVQVAESNGGVSTQFLTVTVEDVAFDQPQVTGTNGADTLTTTGDAYVYGLFGNDTLIGSARRDRLYGDSGGDLIRPGAGSDFVYGGIHEDTVDYSNAVGGVYVMLRDGYAYETTTAGASYASPGTAGPTTTDYLSDIENVIGSAFDDRLYGTSLQNTFRPGGGSDLVNGLGFYDTVDYSDAIGGVLVSLTSNPQAPAGSNGYAYEATTAGDSFIDTAAALSRGFTTDSLVGITHITGSAFDDRLYGNTGDNIFRPGAGSDYVYGLGGTHDTVDYANAIGGVYVDLGQHFARETTSAGASYLHLAAVGTTTTDHLSGITDVTSSAFDDRIYGSSTDNTIVAGDGNDYVYAGAGWDTLSGGNGNDVLSGQEDTDNLVGGDGNDLLIGGLGDDWLHGNAGADTFSFRSTYGANFGHDTIYDFSAAEGDRIDLRGYGLTFGDLAIGPGPGSGLWITAAALGDNSIRLSDSFVPLPTLTASHFLF